MYHDETYLMHYGVKGMKWGVRRFQNYDGTRIKGAAKGYAKSAGNLVKTQASRRVKNNEYSTYRRSKTMTDKELRDANKRYQLEKQYRDNVRNDRRDGMTAVERIFDKGGSIFVSAAIGAAAGGAGAMIGKKILAKSASKVLVHDDLTSEDYLMHHGVKGMKWGVRHDPQSTGRMRRRAANQQYRQSVKTAGRRNIQAFRENYGSREARRSSNQQFRNEVNAAKQKNKEAFALSNKQKKLLKGAAIGAAVVGAGAIGMAALKSGIGKAAISKGAKYLRMGKTDAKIMKIGVKDAINSGKSNLKRTVDNKRAEAYVDKIIKNDRKRIEIVKRRSQVANNLTRKNNKDLADRTKKYNTYMSTVRTDWRGAYAVPKYRTKGNIKVIGKTY